MYNRGNMVIKRCFRCILTGFPAGFHLFFGGGGELKDFGGVA